MRARAACRGLCGVCTWALTCCTCRGPRQSELLTDEKLAEFNEAFDLFDKKKEGKIPSGDLISVFQAMKLNISKREEREYLSVQCTPAPPLFRSCGPSSEWPSVGVRACARACLLCFQGVCNWRLLHPAAIHLACTDGSPENNCQLHESRRRLTCLRIQMLDPNGEGAVSKHDTVPLIAKRLETRETTDQLIAAFRVFDKQNRGSARAHVQRIVAFPDSQLHALARLPWVELLRAELIFASCKHRNNIP